MELICKKSSQNFTLEETMTSTQEENIIVCAYCNNYITRPSKQIIVNQSFSHIFANPHGNVFEIGCFSQALGCRSSSISSFEFSWFPGFSWQTCICSLCLNHLGWIFSSDSERFYGLILENLIFP